MHALWLAATATGSADPAQAFSDPSFWLNAGALGVGFWFFMSGRLHSNREMERVESASSSAMTELRKQHETTVKMQKDAHEQAMQRMDDHVRQLIIERDKANAERNEAIGVMRDFTMMAGAVLNQQPPNWRPSRSSQREVSGDG